MLPFRYLASLTLWLALWIPFYLLGFLAGWAGLLFCTRESEHLPWLWWPWDNSHGINGTLNGNNPKWVVICNPEIKDFPVYEQGNYLRWLIESKAGKERAYRKRWIWLFWRNPVSNLSLYPMGVSVTRPVRRSTRLHEFGIMTERVTAGWPWFYSVLMPYNARRGLYFGFGWKLLDIDPTTRRARFIFRISPYRELS